MNTSFQIAIEIMSALLTGGFLLFFVETMHVESDVRRRFKEIMNPFYHKLSLLVIYLSHMKSSMSIPRDSSIGKKLKSGLDKITRRGVVSLATGCDIPFMESEKLHDMCEEINNIWYVLEKNPDLRRRISIEETFTEQRAKDALVQLYPYCEGKLMDASLLHDISGQFYIDFWQPVEHCTINFEYWKKWGTRSRVMLYVAMGFCLMSLIATMLWGDCMCPQIPCAMAILASVLFSICIGLIAWVIRLSNSIFRFN